MRGRKFLRKFSHVLITSGVCKRKISKQTFHPPTQCCWRAGAKKIRSGFSTRARKTASATLESLGDSPKGLHTPVSIPARAFHSCRTERPHTPQVRGRRRALALRRGTPRLLLTGADLAFELPGHTERKPKQGWKGRRFLTSPSTR